MALSLGEGQKEELGAAAGAAARVNEPLLERSLEIGGVATGSDAGTRAGGL